MKLGPSISGKLASLGKIGGKIVRFLECLPTYHGPKIYTYPCVHSFNLITTLGIRPDYIHFRVEKQRTVHSNYVFNMTHFWNSSFSSHFSITSNIKLLFVIISIFYGEKKLNRPNNLKGPFWVLRNYSVSPIRH